MERSGGGWKLDAFKIPHPFPIGYGIDKSPNLAASGMDVVVNYIFAKQFSRHAACVEKVCRLPQ
jgi:hypothetical protein